MSQRLRHLVPKVLTAGIFLNLLILFGCGGEAGIENGQIIGKVFSNLRGSTATRQPEPGVTVVAEGQSATQKLIRSTVSDANGVYVLASLPVGEYQIGYAKVGFITIDTSQGATNSRTAVGAQVKVVVEPGGTAVAPDVTMRAALPTGNATIIVTVLDASTGQPITDATVSAIGGSVTENSDGVYTLSVPLIPSGEESYGSFRQIDIDVAADGFQTDTGFDVDNPYPDQTYRITRRLTPLTSGRVQGTYRFSQYQTVYQNATISLRVKDLGLASFAATVNSQNFTWDIQNLPPSTNSISRQFDLIFSHPDIKTYTLQRVVMPKDGTKTITQPVVLEPITVDVIGQVLVQSTTQADQPQAVPSGADDSVFIPATGQRASIVNGSFLIPKVPVQQAQNDQGYTVKVVATDPTSGTKFCKSVTAVKPASDGTANPVYNMGLIVANESCSTTATP